MKRFTKVCVILGVLLLVLGCLVAGAGFAMGAVGDIQAANQPSPTTEETCTVPPDCRDFLELDLLDTDLTVSPSSDGNLYIHYSTAENRTYDLRREEQNGGTGWVMVAKDVPTGWTGFRLAPSPIDRVRVELPTDFRGNLTVSSTSGDVSLTGLSAESVSLVTDSGDLFLQDLNARHIDVLTNSGDVRGKHLTAAYSMTLSADSGDLSLQDLSADTEAVLSTNSGDQDLNGFSGPSLSMKSDSGDIRARDLGQETVLSCFTNSGDVDLP